MVENVPHPPPPVEIAWHDCHVAAPVLARVTRVVEGQVLPGRKPVAPPPFLEAPHVGAGVLRRCEGRTHLERRLLAQPRRSPKLAAPRHHDVPRHAVVDVPPADEHAQRVVDDVVLVEPHLKPQERHPVPALVRPRLAGRRLGQPDVRVAMPRHLPDLRQLILVLDRQQIPAPRLAHGAGLGAVEHAVVSLGCVDPHAPVPKQQLIPPARWGVPRPLAHGARCVVAAHGPP
mmetsp:Transcript_33918/g.80816  ORF Transcript_33918/g.80816 Transcript_33918/m.80816 type:complete len:231 (+) Transcript_33918:487-1179(+)